MPTSMQDQLVCPHFMAKRKRRKRTARRSRPFLGTSSTKKPRWIRSSTTQDTVRAKTVNSPSLPKEASNHLNKTGRLVTTTWIARAAWNMASVSTKSRAWKRPNSTPLSWRASRDFSRLSSTIVSSRLRHRLLRHQVWIWSWPERSTDKWDRNMSPCKSSKTNLSTRLERCYLKTSSLSTSSAVWRSRTRWTYSGKKWPHSKENTTPGSFGLKQGLFITLSEWSRVPLRVLEET